MSADSFEFFNVRCYCWNLAGSSWYYPWFKPKTLNNTSLQFNWSPPPLHLKTSHRDITLVVYLSGLPVMEYEKAELRSHLMENIVLHKGRPGGSTSARIHVMWKPVVTHWHLGKEQWLAVHFLEFFHGSVKYVKWLYLKGSIGKVQTALCSVALQRSSGAATRVTIKMETSFDRCTWSAAASRMLWPAQHDARPSCWCYIAEKNGRETLGKGLSVEKTLEALKKDLGQEKTSCLRAQGYAGDDESDDRHKDNALRLWAQFLLPWLWEEG